MATSIPELLTVSFSALAGLIGTSVYNIISSNIINLAQYIFSIFISKNQRAIQNKAIVIDLILVIFTILIPLGMMVINISFEIQIVPIFILLLLLFYYINNNAHKLYLKKQSKIIEKEILEEQKWVRGKVKIISKYLLLLIVTSVLLYLVGNLLSVCLENLAQIFNIPELFLGVALGFITSIPELITFYESQKHHKREKDAELGVIEATNNLLTSNLLNLFVIQSVGILIYSFISGS